MNAGRWFSVAMLLAAWVPAVAQAQAPENAPRLEIWFDDASRLLSRDGSADVPLHVALRGPLPSCLTDSTVVVRLGLDEADDWAHAAIDNATVVLRVGGAGSTPQLLAERVLVARWHVGSAPHHNASQAYTARVTGIRFDGGPCLGSTKIDHVGTAKIRLVLPERFRPHDVPDNETIVAEDGFAVDGDCPMVIDDVAAAGLPAPGLIGFVAATMAAGALARWARRRA